MPTHYEVLSLTPEATIDDIKKAYRKKALQWHPDKNRDNADVATVRFKEINEAHETLADPKRKTEYDRTLNAKPKNTPLKSQQKNLLPLIVYILLFLINRQKML